MTKRLIYTDLDSLFDTEVALLGLMDNRLVTEYLAGSTTVNNGILYLSYSVFFEMFKDRNRHIFSMSKNSYGADIIKNILTDSFANNDKHRGVDVECILEINTHPYLLTEKECSDIKDFYTKYFPLASKVNVISKAELSKAYVNKLSIAVMRHGIDWFITSKMKDPTFRCPHLKLITSDRVYNERYLRDSSVDIDKVRRNLKDMYMSDVTIDFVDKEIFMIRLDGEMV